MAHKKPKLYLNYTLRASAARYCSEIDMPNDEETFLSLYYPNGEHAMTSETYHNVRSGRAAAQRLLKYIDANFVDNTLE